MYIYYIIIYTKYIVYVYNIYRYMLYKYYYILYIKINNASNEYGVCYFVGISILSIYDA